MAVVESEQIGCKHEIKGEATKLIGSATRDENVTEKSYRERKGKHDEVGEGSYSHPDASRIHSWGCGDSSRLIFPAAWRASHAATHSVKRFCVCHTRLARSIHDDSLFGDGFSTGATEIAFSGKVHVSGYLHGILISCALSRGAIKKTPIHQM